MYIAFNDHLTYIFPLVNVHHWFSGQSESCLLSRYLQWRADNITWRPRTEYWETNSGMNNVRRKHPLLRWARARTTQVKQLVRQTQRPSIRDFYNRCYSGQEMWHVELGERRDFGPEPGWEQRTADCSELCLESGKLSDACVWFIRQTRWQRRSEHAWRDFIPLMLGRRVWRS